MKVTVFGAAGHTGRFVLAELLRRGHAPIAVARDVAQLAGCDTRVERRTVAFDDAASLDRCLRDARVAINCAGPFLDSAAPLVEAALRCGVAYLDIAAEQESARATFAAFDAPARERGIAILPSVAFFGALGDLLATAAMGDWTRADRIEIGIALDGWWPTIGTRKTGARNTVPRLVLAGGALVPQQPSPARPWHFPEPFGLIDVVEVPLTETILVSQHLDVTEFHNYVNEAPLRDLSDPETPPPQAVDERGRSTQSFVIGAIARRENERRQLFVSGRDIYAVTAPIVVEAAERVGEGVARGGVYAAGDLFDAEAYLRALARTGDLIFDASARR